MVKEAREMIQSSCLRDGRDVNNTRECLGNIRQIGEEEEGDRGDVCSKDIGKREIKCVCC